MKILFLYYQGMLTGGGPRSDKKQRVVLEKTRRDEKKENPPFGEPRKNEEKGS